MQFKDIAPQAIMLIGIPGSGKSTYIKKLIEENPDREYVILSTDDILEFWGNEKGLNYREAWKQISFKKVGKEFRRRLDEAVSNNRNMILDQTNLTGKSRAKKLNKIPDGYEKIGIVFETDFDEIERRLAKRAAENGKYIPDSIIRNMINYYQPPSKQEFDRIINVRN